MKKSLHIYVLAALACIGLAMSPKALAITEVSDYVEDFETFVGGDPDCAPAYWLHYDAGTVRDKYIAKQTGGHDDGAYVEISKDCNPYYMTDNCLVTLPVKGKVSFWIKGATTSTKLEMYKMTYAGGKITKGTTISKPTGFAMSTEWQKVEIKVDDYTRIGILLRSDAGAIDDFSAEFADKSEIVNMSVSNIVLPEKIVADTEGKATVNVKFDLTNNGTSAVEADSYSFKAGVCNYLGDALTTVCETTAEYPALAVGETKEIELSFEYILADPAISESKSFGIENTLSGTVTKIATSKAINSIAGVLNVKYQNGTSDATLSNNGKIEAGVLTAKPYACPLKLTNTGNTDIVISDIQFSGDLEDCELPQLPLTVATDGTTADLAINLHETAGGKTGTVKLVYSNGISDECEFTYTLSGAVKDEDAWIEDFQSYTTPNLPKGWIIGEGDFRTYKGSYETNVYASGSSYNVSSLITSKMKLTQGGAITVQGVRYDASTVKKDALLTVYYSTDRTNWVELGGVLAKEPTGRIPFNTYVANSGTADWGWYNFSLKNVETGDYYVKFETAPFKIDNIFGMEPAEVDHDFMIGAFTANPKGEVNTAFSAKLTVNNMNSKADGDFAITLYENGVAVAELPGEEIEAYGTQTFEFSYMPHKAGDVELTAEVVVAEKETLTSEAATVTIAKEDNTIKACNLTIDQYTSSGLVGGKFNKIQFFVPAEATGLTEGAAFEEISFNVYNSSSYSDVTVPYTIWIEEIDEMAAFTTDDKIDFELPEAETAAATGTYLLKAGESSSTMPVDLIIALDKPIAYSGKAYKITMEMNLESSTFSFYAGIHTFAEQYFRSYCKNSETGTYPGAKVEKTTPVVTFRYAMEAATVSGKLVYDGEALEGVEVTLIESAAKSRAIAETASAVAYSATTDADGNFSIPVIKSDRSYKLVAAIDDSYTYNHNAIISPAGENVDLATIETKPVEAGMAEAAITTAKVLVGKGFVKVEGADATVYTLTGIAVASVKDGEAARLAAGIYVVKAGNDTVCKIIVK